MYNAVQRLAGTVGLPNRIVCITLLSAVVGELKVVDTGKLCCGMRALKTFQTQNTDRIAGPKLTTNT